MPEYTKEMEQLLRLVVNPDRRKRMIWAYRYAREHPDATGKELYDGLRTTFGRGINTELCYQIWSAARGRLMGELPLGEARRQVPLGEEENVPEPQPRSAETERKGYPINGKLEEVLKVIRAVMDEEEIQALHIERNEDGSLRVETARYAHEEWTLPSAHEHA